MVGDPVDLATGNVFTTEVDYVGGGGNRLSFSRYYNGLPNVGGEAFLGGAWRHSYSHQLLGKANVYAYLIRPDGRAVRFDYNGTAFVGQASEHGALSEVYGNGAVIGWKYVSPDGDAENYSSAGRITSIQFKRGGTLTMAYSDGIRISSVSDGLGRSLTFAYTNGVLTSVKGPTGATEASFTYDSWGRLATATHADGSMRSYAYQLAAGSTATVQSLLTAIYDEANIPVSNFTYDGSGRAATSSHAAGVNGLSFSYSGSSTQVTNSLGAIETHEFSNATGRPQAETVTLQCQTCGSGIQRVATYDGMGNMLSSTDKRGVLTCSTYDGVRGLLLQTVEGLVGGSDTCGSTVPDYARVTTYTWSPTLAVLTGVARPQLVTTYQLDTLGRAMSMTVQPTTDVSGASGFSATGNGTAHVSTYSYDAQGNSASIRGPRTDVTATTSYTYDSAENLISVTDPTGLATTFGSYDANGRSGSITEPNGLQTGITYDARGRVTQLNRGGAMTTYSYSLAGLLLSSTLPSGVSLSFGYDAANRLVRTSDSLGNQRVLTLDLEGNVTQESVTGNGGALAFSRAMAYDQLSRLSTLTKAQ